MAHIAFFDRNLTVVTAMHPIVTEIHPDGGDAPCPRWIPWQSPPVVSLVDYDVRVILCAAEEDTANEEKKYQSFDSVVTCMITDFQESANEYADNDLLTRQACILIKIEETNIAR